MTQPTSNITSVRTIRTFLAKGACSETLLHVLNDSYGHPMNEEERASLLFAGGIVQHGYQCGMIWGATLAAGAQAYRLYGAGPDAESRAIAVARRLVDTFRNQNHEINCLEITELDKSATAIKMFTKFFIKGGVVHCFRMATQFSPTAREVIDKTLSEPNADIPPVPVSCTALLARKMGASDIQATMAAGLAGGIGLCGGACGALATAIWLRGVQQLKRGDKLTYKAPYALDVINKFVKCSDYEFECSKITGRTFESVADHADFIRNGGCAKIIGTLAERT